jgi:two-component system phosphate regulon response regulator PhoB
MISNDKEEEQMPTILVVEDDVDLCELITFNLIHAGYNVLACHNGSEALAVLAEHYRAIKLIILDLGLPVIRGSQMIRQMKQDPILRQIPVLLCTASEPPAIVQGLNNGADDYLQKPFSIQKELLLRIQVLLNRARRSYSDEQHKK